MNRMWENIILPIINLTNSKCIVEIGSEKGINTKNIMSYCLENDAAMVSIDPLPLFDVDDFKKMYGKRFSFFKELSLDILPNLRDYDCVLIDGDHNWYTVYNELKSIENNFNQDNFPLIFLHDVSWPYARRDLYYNPETIPPEFLNEYAQLGMHPDSDNLLVEGGLNTRLYNAVEINTPKNGVLTAIEDFLNETLLDLDFHKVPIFYGLGIIHKKDEQLYEKIEEIIYNFNVLDLVENFYIRGNLSRERRILDYMKKTNQLKKNGLAKDEEIKNLSENVNYLIKESSKKDEDIEQLSNKVEGLNSISDKYADLEEVNKKQQDVINGLENDLEINKNELNEKIDILKNNSLEIKNLTDNIYSLNQTTNEQLMEIDGLKEDVENLRNKNINLSSVNENLEEVNKKQQDVINGLKDDLEINRNELNEKIDILKNNSIEIKNLNDNIYSLNKTRNEQLEIIDYLNDDLDNLRNKNICLSGVNDDLNIKIVDLHNKTFLLEEENEKKSKELIVLEEKLSTYEKDLNKKIDDLEMLNKRNIVLTETKNSQLDEIVKLNNNQIYLNEIISDLNNKIQELSILSENRLNDLNELNDKYQYTVNNKYRLEQENNYLKNLNFTTKKELDDLLNSRSWKLTSIFRKFKGFLKN